VIRRLLAASASLALLQAQALAGTEHIGVITMFLCDDGLDLCSNTLSSSLISSPIGPFTEDFVFDFVDNFIDVPDNVPLLKGTAFLETSNPTDFSSASVMLYDYLGVQFGFSTPFAPHGSNYQAQADDLILPGTGYYVEVKGVSNANGLPLEVSVSAFDLGPVVPVLMPEPSTWAMMLLGGTGLGFAACRRTSRQLAIG
jgi:PEP-CTERM motif